MKKQLLVLKLALKAATNEVDEVTTFMNIAEEL